MYCNRFKQDYSGDPKKVSVKSLAQNLCHIRLLIRRVRSFSGYNWKIHRSSYKKNLSLFCAMMGRKRNLHSKPTRLKKHDHGQWLLTSSQTILTKMFFTSKRVMNQTKSNSPKKAKKSSPLITKIFLKLFTAVYLLMIKIWTLR